MKSKKVTMLAAALVVAVVAAAGIGYAATTYKATTVNEHNSIDSTYLTLTQSGNAAYTNNFFTGIYYDSVNTAQNTTKYTPVCGYKINQAGTAVEEDAENGNLAKVSKDLALNIDSSNSTKTPVDLKVTVTGFTPVNGLTYKMILCQNGTIVGNPADYNNGWTFSNIAVTASETNAFTIALYVTSPNGVTGDLPANFDSAGFTNYDGEAEPVVEGSVFTFVVTATVN